MNDIGDKIIGNVDYRYSLPMSAELVPSCWYTCFQHATQAPKCVCQNAGIKPLSKRICKTWAAVALEENFHLRLVQIAFIRLSSAFRQSIRHSFLRLWR